MAVRSASTGFATATGESSRSFVQIVPKTFRRTLRFSQRSQGSPFELNDQVVAVVVSSIKENAAIGFLFASFMHLQRPFDRIDEQEATITQPQKQIETLSAGVQKVSTQLEMIRRAPQIVENR